MDKARRHEVIGESERSATTVVAPILRNNNTLFIHTQEHTPQNQPNRGPESSFHTPEARKRAEDDTLPIIGTISIGAGQELTISPSGNSFIRRSLRS